MEAKMEERIATLHAQMMAYQQSLQQHYNTQMQNMASFFQSIRRPGRLHRLLFQCSLHRLLLQSFFLCLLLEGPR